MSKWGMDQLVETTGEILGGLSDLPNVRVGSTITNRNEQIITWRLPNGAAIQMYINPENLEIKDAKHINSSRTKGGYVVQYWGEELTQITLRGTTGSAGVKGIGVLENIYKSEQRYFDSIVAAQTSELIGNVGGKKEISDENIEKGLRKHMENQVIRSGFSLRPSLAALATNVTMYYQGVSYRGFFTALSSTESVSDLGLFTYNISFTALEKRGYRKNFMAWHKEPVADDPAGQLLNALGNSAGNAMRGWFGLSPQAAVPPAFHPESAPLTFGGNSIEATLTKP